MVLKNLCINVLWTKVASTLEGLIEAFNFVLYTKIALSVNFWFVQSVLLLLEISLKELIICLLLHKFVHSPGYTLACI